MCHFDTDSYFVAIVNGVSITFVSYSEYLEYVEENNKESEPEQQQQQRIGAGYCCKSPITVSKISHLGNLKSISKVR